MSPGNPGQRLIVAGGRARGRGDRGRRRLATRQDPAAAEGAVPDGATAAGRRRDDAGQRGRDTRRVRPAARRARATMERLGREQPKDPVVQFNYAARAVLRRLLGRRARPYADGEEGRPRHDVRGPGGRAPAPAVLPGRLPAVPVDLEPTRCSIRGAMPAAAGAPALAPSAPSRGGSAAARTTRGAGRRGRRAVRQGRPHGVVLAARPARACGSRAASRCVTTSGCCSRGPGSATRRSRSSRRPSRSGRKRRSGKAAAQFWSGHVRNVGLTAPPNEPDGLWRPSGSDATVPHRSGGERRLRGGAGGARKRLRRDVDSTRTRVELAASSEVDDELQDDEEPTPLDGVDAPAEFYAVDESRRSRSRRRRRVHRRTRCSSSSRTSARSSC